ncbi:MAG: response regulator [Desulfovibrionaceae bacterium]
MKVLLVDDETELVSALAERLSFRGVEADWADSGDKALRMAAQASYDVAVLDVKMPRMGGLELRRKMAEMRPGMRFVFLSGHGSEEDYLEGSAEASSYLIKPIDIEELLRRIRAE